MNTAKIGKDYEDIVEALLRTVVRARPDSPRGGRREEEVVVQRGPRLLGRSGQEHRIDISFTLSAAGVEILILVECKCYGHAVGIDDLLEFSARLDDIGANKGIFVTNRGFAPGARRVARAKRIALVVARRGTWEVLHRAGAVPPRWEPSWCEPGSALVTVTRRGVELAFCPVDARDLVAIDGAPVAGGAAREPGRQQLDERVVFSIVEEGTRRFRLRTDVEARASISLAAPDAVGRVVDRAMERARRVTALWSRLALLDAADAAVASARLLLEVGELDAAEAFTRLVERGPPEDATETIVPILTLARALVRAGRQDLAEVAYRRVLAAIEALPPDRAPVPPGVVLTELADLARSAGRLDEAARCLRQALDRLRAPAVARPEEDRRGLVALLVRLATLERGRGRLREAEASYREALGACAGYPSPDGAARRAEEGELLVGLGSLLREQGRSEEAGQLLREAVATFRALRRAERSGPPAAYGEGAGLLGALCLSDGRVEEAREVLLEALDVFRQRALLEPSADAEAAVRRALAALAAAHQQGERAAGDAVTGSRGA